MRDLKEMCFQVWTDGRQSDPTRDRIMLSWEADGTDEGMQRCSFYMSRVELETLVSGKANAAVDCSVKLEVFGDMWTFVRFELPNRSAGKAEIVFRRIEIPRRVLQIVLRKAREIWRIQGASTDPYSLPRVEIELSAETRARYSRLYGCARGRVEVVVDSRVSDRFMADSAESALFVQRVKYLSNIAHNTTSAHYQTALLRLFPDGDSYYWTAITPRGRVTMNGGLIRREKGDWSIHT